MSDSLGIYISIPFCRAKCSYCNFASGVFGSERMAAYIDHLAAEIQAVRRKADEWNALLPKRVDSLYFGGGTPSLLSSEQMRQVLAALQQIFQLDADAEITMECAPGQISEDILQTMPMLGFNRVSLGVQSFMDREAASVGRLHTRATTLRDIGRLRSVGIDDINLDLIAGLPHQTMESWQESLDEALATGVPHLSVYMLDVDEDSRLGREILAGGMRYGVGLVPNEETIAAMYCEACEKFSNAGVSQYEISNFARPGHFSRHNLKYWTRQPYLGFGLDAHSFLDKSDGNAVRISTTDDLAEYLDRSAEETLTPVLANESVEEMWFLGLRLTAGVSLPEMEKKIGTAAMRLFEPVLAEYQQQGLLERAGTRIRLTRQGRLFANEVFSRFLGVLEPTGDKKQESQREGAFV